MYKEFKILFCSPYRQGDGFVQGGMAMWGAIIVNYYNRTLPDGVKLLPISFDRKSYIVNKNTPFWTRVTKGVKELGQPLIESIKVLKGGDVNAVHVCTSGSLSLVKDYILIKVARRYGVKSVIHFHMGRIPAILNSGGWEKRLLLKVLNKVSVIAVMDPDSFKILEDKGFKKIVNIPNPLSDDTLNSIEKNSGNTIRQANRVLFAGHVVKTKGVYELVKACSKIKDVDLHIVGRCSNEMREDLLNVWSNSKANISILGEVSHDEVIKEMLEASCFALPSYTEGFPNVIIEAMACGCPITATNVGAIPNMLDVNGNEQCGDCVLPQEIDELKESIEKIIKDDDYAKNLSLKVVTRVNNNYSINKIWDILMEVWKNYDCKAPVSYI